MTTHNEIPWIQDTSEPHTREWEEFYRNRWQYDKVVRSTHGVNCTGSCSWNIHVKDGIVTWELQAIDYPLIDKNLPPHEPRGCQRGISYSWYLYSPLRVKYPYIRGSLIDLWRRARKLHEDPVAAWRAIQEDPESRKRYQRSRGKGGFRRASWDMAKEIISASAVHTIQKHGPDRIAGFSPIPAMSQISYASGARMLQLMGGLSLSFYDWYCDLPCASPEIWGEQTDVNESADWYNAKDARGHGLEPEHDPHAGRALRRRGAPQRHQDGGVLARLQPGREVRRRMGVAERGPGRRLVDGGHARDPQGVPLRTARSRTSWTTPRSTRTGPSWSS